MNRITRAIANKESDNVLVEARQERYDECGVVDGLVDMTVIDSYYRNNDNKVGMMDLNAVVNDLKESLSNQLLFNFGADSKFYYLFGADICTLQTADAFI